MWIQDTRFLLVFISFSPVPIFLGIRYKSALIDTLKETTLGGSS